MSLQYLGVGISRTGTTSLCAALNLLGIKTLHHEPRRLDTVLFGREQQPSFHVYEDCDAIVDMPHGYFFPELGAAYPGLKYILTERDEEAWYVSACRHHLQRHAALRGPGQGRTLVGALTFLRLFYGLSSFADFPKYPFLLKKRYREWNAFVKASLPPADLLVLNFCDGGHGWRELCAFVNKEQPDSVFPHKNKT